MSQRNFMNERYTDESRTGKTRKSAASAKPKAARAATVRDPAPKTKKQKKEEARAREAAAQQKANAMESRFEETEGYKRLRRIWWVFLAAAILCTVLSFAFQRSNEDGSMNSISMVVMVLAYVFIIAAFYIDLGKIRKERKLYNAALASNKSKEARREQKRIRAEQREQEREAAEKYEAAKAEEEAKKAERAETGFLARFRKKQADSEEEPAE